MQSLVSIIIPAYNASGYIGKTIDSVIAQTYNNRELILVNDGSTDKTGEIMESYKERYENIKVIHKPNSGVSDSRNTGLMAANGEFVAFLDSDDVWQENNLALKINALKEKDLDGVYSACAIIDENSQQTGKTKSGSAAVSLDDMLSWKANYITIPSGIVFRKKTMDTIGGFDVHLSNNADQELLMRFLAAGKKLGYISESTWFYRRHSGNMSANIPVMEKDTLRVYELADQKGLFHNFSFKRKCFAKVYIILAGSWWKDAGNRSRGIYFLTKAFFTAPVFTLKELFK